MPTKTVESAKFKDTMRAEYDMNGGERGRYARRRKSDVVMMPIAPDVAQAFPDADSVNQALRLLLKTARKAAPAA
jgi:hypothetical protein